MFSVKKPQFYSWMIALAVFIIGLAAYPLLPGTMASHWGLSGEANGYTSKATGIVLLPAIMVAIMLIFQFLPKIDPLKENIRQFKKYYDRFVMIAVGFLGYTYLLTIIWNLGIKFDLFRFLVPAIALLYYFLGRILPEARPNWIFGIRTPWTLSNGRVWYRTHELAGKLFKLAGGLSLGGFLWPSLAIYFLLIPTVTVSLWLFVYSYLEFRKETFTK